MFTHYSDHIETFGARRDALRTYRLTTTATEARHSFKGASPTEEGISHASPTAGRTACSTSKRISCYDASSSDYSRGPPFCVIGPGFWTPRRGCERARAPPRCRSRRVRAGHRHRRRRRRPASHAAPTGRHFAVCQHTAGCPPCGAADDGIRHIITPAAAPSPSLQSTRDASGNQDVGSKEVGSPSVAPVSTSVALQGLGAAMSSAAEAVATTTSRLQFGRWCERTYTRAAFRAASLAILRLYSHLPSSSAP